MIKTIIITFMFCSPLFCGEWSYLSTLPKDLDNSKIQVINQNDLMIGGNFGLTSPYVEKSTNSGKSFEVIFKDTVKTNLFGFSREITSFHHQDINHILLMCAGFRYWYSDDAGKTWLYDSLVGNSSSFTEASSYKNKVITMSRDSIFLSSNYGSSWESFKFNLEHNFDLSKGKMACNYFTFLNDSTIIANGIYFVDFYHKDNVYFITISKDTGRTWEISTIKDRSETLFFHGLSGTEVYAVGGIQVAPYSSKYIDIFKRSTDGGYTWQSILDTIYSPEFPLLDLEFLDDKNGIAFTRGWSKLWRTTDGGISWVRDNKIDEFDYPPDDYAYLPNGEILAVARTGKVYKWSDPVLSVEDESKFNTEPSIKLYPNPLSINKPLNIEFLPRYLGQIELSIIDITGKKVSSYTLNIIGNNKQTLTYKPDNDLTTGTYFIQIGYKNGIAERQKFVVE
ncbi:MAG: T9SS type A sorting domain-containing protein [Candidatus Kapaibacterium sp.]